MASLGVAMQRRCALARKLLANAPPIAPHAASRIR
jgi:hypothetical protein